MQYVVKNRTRSLIIAILLITLLLHILFLYFFTTVQFSYGADTINSILQSLFEDKRTEENKILQSHAAHSAPVIFQDDPQDNKPQPKQAPQPIPEPPQTLVAHSSNHLKKDPVEQKEEIQKSLMPQKKSEEKQMKEDQNVRREPPQSFGRASDERNEENHTFKQESKEEIVSKSTKSELNEKSLTIRPACPELSRGEELRDREATRERNNKKSDRKSEHDNYAPRAPRAERDKNATQNQSSSKSVSLADLGKQFMQKVSASIDTGGYGAMNVQGTGYGHPSAYQIALERYVAKMCKEIETAYKINTNQSIQATQHKPFCLLVELNSNGSINSIYPLESSGVARIDEFAMSVFKSASKSFSKLPEAMGTHFRIQFGINHIDHMAYLSKGGTLSMH